MSLVAFDLLYSALVRTPVVIQFKRTGRAQSSSSSAIRQSVIVGDLLLRYTSGRRRLPECTPIKKEGLENLCEERGKK